MCPGITLVYLCDHTLSSWRHCARFSEYSNAQGTQGLWSLVPLCLIVQFRSQMLKKKKESDSVIVTLRQALAARDLSAMLCEGLGEGLPSHRGQRGHLGGSDALAGIWRLMDISRRRREERGYRCAETHRTQERQKHSSDGHDRVSR